MAVALYPGSFDPVHNGHVAIVEVASGLFDQVVVAIGHNQDKPSGFFTPAERVAMVEEVTAHLDNVTVVSFTGLVTVAAAENGADCLLKGVRSATDLDAEMLQANMNAKSSDDLPTVFLPGLGEPALISSRYVREIAARGGDVTRVVSALVAARLAEQVGGEEKEDTHA